MINNTINAFTEINGIAYINLFNDFYMYCMAKGITVDSLLNANDHLHPNDDGYYLMYRLICKGLGVTAQYFFNSPLFEDDDLDIN